MYFKCYYNLNIIFIQDIEGTKYKYYQTFKLQDRLNNKSLQIYFIQLDIGPNLETL